MQEEGETTNNNNNSNHHILQDSISAACSVSIFTTSAILAMPLK